MAPIRRGKIKHDGSAARGLVMSRGAPERDRTSMMDIGR